LRLVPLMATMSDMGHICHETLWSCHHWLECSARPRRTPSRPWNLLQLFAVEAHRNLHSNNATLSQQRVLHCKGEADFSQVQGNVTSISQEHCSRLQQSRCYWWLNYLFCCIHCSRHSQCFTEHRTTPEIAPSCAGSRPSSNIRFLGPTRVNPQMASRSVRPFLHILHPCDQRYVQYL